MIVRSFSNGKLKFFYHLLKEYHNKKRQIDHIYNILLANYIQLYNVDV